MITPKRPSGFNELLPADQLAFNKMISKIELAYEQHGYSPIETPALELSEVLLAKEGGETAKQVYRFSKGDTDLAMRFDLTIPLARYAAEHYNELVFPFRRYQIQEVWRAEKAQAGRYRQFYQCDIDTLGSNNPLADADVILAARAALHALGLKNIKFKISHRGLFQGILRQAKPDSLTISILRAVDKLEKQGKNIVIGELKQIGLSNEESQHIVDFVEINGSIDNVVKKLNVLSFKKTDFTETTNNLKEITDLLVAGGMKPTEFIIDLSIARGFDYYTGMVFETVLIENPKAGSICGGGRYDNLLGQYRKDPIPGVGASIGLSRLFSAIKENNLNEPANPAKALIAPLESNVLDYCLKVATTLRRKRINTLVYPGTDKISKQISYADKLGIPYVLVIGGNERDQKTVTVKDMSTGKQVSAPIEEAISTINKRIKKSL